MLKSGFFKILVIFVLPISVFSQQILTIDRAIAESMNYVSEKLLSGAKVAVLKIEAPNKNLADYISVECKNYISNNTNLILVNEKELEDILLKQYLQQRNIDNLNSATEEEVLQIARFLDAEFAVFVEFSKRNDIYRFFVQVLDAETSVIKGIQAFNVRLDEILADFTGEKYIPPAQQDLMAVKEKLAQIEAMMERERTIVAPEVVIIERDGDLQKLQRELEELRAAIIATQVPPKKSSRFFMAHRYLLTTPVVKGSGNGAMKGYEFEFGGLKREKLIFSGTTLIVGNTPTIEKPGSSGGGIGLFLAPRIISAGKVFRFAPGINMGTWTYTVHGSTEHVLGGPDFRIMAGYRRTYLDISYKMQFGYAEERIQRQEMGLMRSYGVNTYFRIKHLWGMGFVFMGKEKSPK